MTADNPRDCDEIADEVLPVDGPHTPERVAAAAALLAEMARRLNHATLPERAGRTLRYPSTIDKVAGSLHRAMALLPQTCDQLAARLNDLAEHPALYDDRRDPVDFPPTATAAMAAFHLAGARAAAHQTADAFARVRHQTTHLGGDTGGEDR